MRDEDPGSLNQRVHPLLGLVRQAWDHLLVELRQQAAHERRTRAPHLKSAGWRRNAKPRPYEPLQRACHWPLEIEIHGDCRADAEREQERTV